MDTDVIGDGPITPSQLSNQKQLAYFNQLRSNSIKKQPQSPPKPLPKAELSPSPPKSQTEYQRYRQSLLRTPTRPVVAADTINHLRRYSYNSSPGSSPSRSIERQNTTPINSSPTRSINRTQWGDKSPHTPLVFDSSFSTLDSPIQTGTPSPSPFQSHSHSQSPSPSVTRSSNIRVKTLEESNIPNLSPLKKLRSFDQRLQRSTTIDSDLSILVDNRNDEIFEEQNDSTISSPVFQGIFNQTISGSPSPTKSYKALSKRHSIKLNDLPTDMQILYKSRPENNIHKIEVFDNLGYVEFWNITAEEGNIFKRWDKLEFEKQNTIFEVFLHLRKIKFNLNRLVNIYGPQFEINGKKMKFSKTDYDKTFGILKEFYEFLNKLIIKKLKPLFDNKFFVSDAEVVKLLRNWFKLLKSKYDYISGSILYLAQLTSTPERIKWITEISKLDVDLQNRSAVAPNELFNSYFIKLFTSVQLLFDRLKTIYKDMNDLYLFNLAEQSETLVKEINNITESTSDLEKKISFNEKLSYKTDIDYSHMEMVDMFNSNRVTKDPITVEMKTKLTWVEAKLVLFDNYLVSFKMKPNPLNLKDKEGFILSKEPIPLQYLNLEYNDDGTHKILKVVNSGSGVTYYFRMVNNFASAVLDRFVQSIQNMIDELWKKLNKYYDFKVISDQTFLMRNNNTSIITPIPIQSDPVFKNLKSTMENPNSVSAIPLSVEYFNKRDKLNRSQRYCIIGTSEGVYMGIANNANSWKLLYSVNNVKNMMINDETLYVLSNSTVYEIPIEKMYDDFYNQFIDTLIQPKDPYLNNINNFTIGYQADSLGIGGTYLFTWDDKMVNYLDLSSMGATWKQFKTAHKIYNLQTVYANNFAIGHIIEDHAKWCISNLNEFRFKSLDEFDVKDILKGEKPIRIFKLPNKSLEISETLVIYSKFCARFKSSMGKYKQSRPDITWFGIECLDASFHIDDKVLHVLGSNSVEIYQLSEEVHIKASLIGCIVGYGMKLLNNQSGKLTLGLLNPHDRGEYSFETIVKVKKRRF